MTVRSFVDAIEFVVASLVWTLGLCLGLAVNFVLGIFFGYGWWMLAPLAASLFLSYLARRSLS